MINAILNGSLAVETFSINFERGGDVVGIVCIAEAKIFVEKKYGNMVASVAGNQLQIVADVALGIGENNGCMRNWKTRIIKAIYGSAKASPSPHDRIDDEDMLEFQWDFFNFRLSEERKF